MPAFQIHNGKAKKILQKEFSNELELHKLIDNNLKEFFGLKYIKDEHITDKHGKRINISAISKIEFTLLIDLVVMGILNSSQIPEMDPSRKLKYISPKKFVEMIFTVFQFDLEYQSQKKYLIDFTCDSISQNPDEARTQVIVFWMQVLNTSDPEVAKTLNIYGFVQQWNQFSQSFISGLLTGLGRISTEELFDKARNECKEIHRHLIPFFEELIIRMEKPGFGKRLQTPKKMEIPNDLFLNVYKDGDEYKLDMNKAGNFLGLLLSTQFVCCDDLLTHDDKDIVSRWANLSSNEWGVDHRKTWAVASLYFLIDAKRKGYKLSENMASANYDVVFNDVSLPQLNKPFSEELVRVFEKIYG